MKKCIVFALAAVMCLSLAGCGDESAYEAYVKMQDKMAGITSMEMTGTADISMTIDGTPTPMAMTYSCKQIIRSETDIDMEMLASTSMSGFQLDSSTYYTDGCMYTEAMGYKVKTKMDFDAVAAQVNMMSPVFLEAAIEEASVEDVDGGKLLSITISADAANEVLSDMVDSLMDSQGTENPSVIYEAIKYTATVDRDYMLKDCRMLFSITMDMGGKSALFEYDMGFDVVSVNSVSAIDFPTDLDSYVEAA